MKVIDLLNKIENGEEVPKEIIYKGKTYYVGVNCLNTKSYYSDYEGNLLLERICSVGQLDDEIKVNKKEEKNELTQEIERLNNIINELEKTLLELHEYWKYDDSYSWQYKNAYDYLQELKGSNSNENL